MVAALIALIALLALQGWLASTAGAQTRWTSLTARACPVSSGVQHEAGHATLEFRRGLVLLAFRRGVGRRRREAIERAAGACAARPVGPVPARSSRRSSAPLTPWELRVPASRVLAVVARLRRYRAVAYAEPDWIMRASALNTVPNDPGFPKQWSDENTGQLVPVAKGGGVPEKEEKPGTPGADDAATSAWNVTTGSKSIVIGEVDTGVEYEHPDLKENIWTNPGGVGGCEKGTHGFNVTSEAKSEKEKCDPKDEDTAYGGHGTHVAGIMAAEGNNGKGVAGLNWHTTILPVKWLQGAGAFPKGGVAELIEALKKLEAAQSEGVEVRVINDSATFPNEEKSEALKEEIKALGEHGILFVTAAGNVGKEVRYPCAYDLANEICATASNDEDKLPSWANSGSTIDLAAPGVSIYSTLREGKYGYLSGGSMAAPQVSGTAALVLSVEPGLKLEQLKKDILDNVDQLPAFKELKSKGRLDVCRAVPGCAFVETRAVNPREVKATTAPLTGSVIPNRASVEGCEFEYGSSPGVYESTIKCSETLSGTGTTPVEVSAEATELAPGTTYHVRLVARNSHGSFTRGKQEFTTESEKPKVITEAPSAITSETAMFAGEVNPHGSQVTACEFEYGTSEAYGTTVPCSTTSINGTKDVPVSATVGALKPGTTYHVRLLATNAKGTEHGQDKSFTTLAAPPAVQTEGASSVGTSSATLAGTVDPNGASIEQGECMFEYGTSSSYGSTAECSLAGLGASNEAVAVTAAISGLSSGTTYHYRLVATNEKGTSDGQDQTFVTSSPSNNNNSSSNSSSSSLGTVGVLGVQEVTPAPVLPNAVLANRVLTVSRSGLVSVKVSCPAGASSCTGSLTLRTLHTVMLASAQHGSKPRHGILTVAVVRFTVLAGQTRTFVVRLTPSARAVLARARLLRLRATILARDPQGLTGTTLTNATLAAAKPPARRR